MASLTHFAGMKVEVGSVLRQRCGWCGVILCDYDLSSGAGEDGSMPPVFPPGSMVRVTGNLSVTVTDGFQADNCALADSILPA